MSSTPAPIAERIDVAHGYPFTTLLYPDDVLVTYQPALQIPWPRQASSRGRGGAARLDAICVDAQLSTFCLGSPHPLAGVVVWAMKPKDSGLIPVGLRFTLEEAAVTVMVVASSAMMREAVQTQIGEERIARLLAHARALATLRQWYEQQRREHEQGHFGAAHSSHPNASMEGGDTAALDDQRDSAEDAAERPDLALQHYVRCVAAIDRTVREDAEVLLRQVGLELAASDDPRLRAFFLEHVIPARTSDDPRRQVPQWQSSGPQVHTHGPR